MKESQKIKMKSKQTLKEIPQQDLPYEKCEKRGVRALSDTELLALILRNGTQGINVLEVAHNILYSNNMQPGLINLPQWTTKQLLELKGVGKVKAMQIQAIAELAKRLAQAKAAVGLSFQNPESIATYYMEDMRHHKQEHMKLLLLDTKSKLIHESTISKGTVNASIISPREIFIDALHHGAVGIIVLHNHPSGDPTPSKEDMRLTKRIFEGGQLIGIELLDHIIIGDQCYVSFRSKGLL